MAEQLIKMMMHGFLILYMELKPLSVVTGNKTI